MLFNANELFEGKYTVGNAQRKAIAKAMQKFKDGSKEIRDPVIKCRFTVCEEVAEDLAGLDWVVDTYYHRKDDRIYNCIYPKRYKFSANTRIMKVIEPDYIAKRYSEVEEDDDDELEQEE